MQSLNNDMDDLNNDMDELFRRAAEEYPLNTKGADWNKIMQQLPDKINKTSGKNKKQENYKYLLLLLLLPIGFICGRYVKNNSKSTEPTHKIEVNEHISRADKINQVAAAPTTGVKSRKPANKVTYAEGVLNKKKTINNLGNDIGKPVSNIKGDNKVTRKSGIGMSANRALSFKKSAIKNNIENKEKSLQTHMATAEYAERIANKTNIAAGKKSPARFASPSKSEGLLQQKDTFAIADTTKKTSALPGKTEQSLLGSKNPEKNQKIFKKKFYYSIVLGPDVSTIKRQRVNNIGYSAGAMLGYHVNSKISVEAGALWDRKNYYTEGKYLDTSRLKLPVRLLILNANGFCDMIEIPVNIKYDFITKKDHSWFVLAGLSGYLMKNEYYDLTYKRFNETGVRGYGYKNSSADLFSIMNVSAGYKKTFGRYSSISIEPYMKFPFRGVGIGKLPITSAGIYISMSRSLR